MEHDERPEVLAEGRFVRLVRKGSWEYVQRRRVSGTVGIVAVTEEGKLILIEQYRPPVGKWVIEIPAGLAGDTAGREQEAMAEAAGRELLEETGYESQEMIYITEGAGLPGLTDETTAVYLARGLKKVGPGGGDDSESIRVHEVPLGQVPAWLDRMRRTGRMIDLRVYAGLYFATNTEAGRTV